MRLAAVLTLTAVLTACGGDEAEPAPQQPDQSPRPQQQVESQPEPTADQPAQRSEPSPPGAQQPDTEPATEPAATRSLYTVQVAAYTNAVTARELASTLRRDGFPVWTSIAEIGGRTFHRVRVGALPTLSATRRLAALLHDRYDWPVWVAPLTPADRLPVNAVPSTREVLRVQGG